MGLFNKFKDLMRDDEEEFFDDDDDMGLLIPRSGDTQSEDVRRLAVVDKNQSSGNKVVNIHTTAQVQVILVKPERFDDAIGIADHLLEKRTVVLNLEQTNKDVSRRLVDFLSGVAYAGGGQIKKVANSTFIITPYNVNIVGDLLDELESTGVFFG